MYSYETRIGYTQVASNGYITPQALLDEFQNCSNFQSDDLGVGLKYLVEHKHGWILAYHEVLFLKRPDSGDEVIVGTNAYKMRGCMGNRNFFLKDMKGGVLAVSDSLWVYMDLENGRMSKVPQEMTDAYLNGSDPRYDMGTHSRKIIVPDDLEHMDDFKIRKSDIDSNGHVNNTVYVALASEFIPEGMEMERLRVEYRKESHYGDTLEAWVKVHKNSVFVVLKVAEVGDTAVVEMIFKDEVEK